MLCEIIILYGIVLIKSQLTTWSLNYSSTEYGPQRIRFGCILNFKQREKLLEVLCNHSLLKGMFVKLVMAVLPTHLAMFSFPFELLHFSIFFSTLMISRMLQTALGRQIKVFKRMIKSTEYKIVRNGKQWIFNQGTYF